MSRPSPSSSATLFDIGTRRKGNDGNMWKVAEDKHGRQYWTKMTCQPKKSMSVKAPKRKTTKKTLVKRKTIKKQTEKRKTIKKPTEKRRKTYTRATRPSPSLSATLFNVGDKRLGNDGNIWKIIETSNGTQRWQKI